MAVGSYGIIRPSDVSPEDVEIYFHYVADRNSTSTVTLKRLSSAEVLTPVYHNIDTTDDISAPNVEILGGLYNLKLTADDFADLGVYTLHIRPKQIRTSITDCGILASLPSVRGLVIDLSNVQIPNFYRIVTSSFYCTPIVSNLTSTSQKAIRYQYSEQATNLMFLTVTPSSAPTNKPNTVPFIGVPSQKIILTNTYLNPTTIEIEMVEHDASTLAHALYGNQSKAVSQGIYTIYDNNNNIYRQYNLYEVKDEFNETLFEIREERNDIDETLNFDTITE